MDNIQKTLDDQIEADLQSLSKTKLGGDDRKAATDQVARLYQLRLDEKKLEHEHEVQTFGRAIKLVLEGAGIIVPNGVALYSVWKSMKIEAEGVIKTDTARRALSWIRPVKFMKLFK